MQSFSEHRDRFWNGKLETMLTMPIRMLLLAIAGWLNEEQQEKIEFLQEQLGFLRSCMGENTLFQ